MSPSIFLEFILPSRFPVSGGRLGETDSLVSLFVSDGGFEIRTRSVPEPVLLSAPQILRLRKGVDLQRVSKTFSSLLLMTARSEFESRPKMFLSPNNSVPKQISNLLTRKNRKHTLRRLRKNRDTLRRHPVGSWLPLEAFFMPSKQKDDSKIWGDVM